MVATAQQAVPAPATSLRIGLVASGDGLADGGAGELAAQAVRAASVRLRASIDIRETLDPATYVPSLESMAADHYDLVIAVGKGEAQAVGEVAREYPHVRFLIVGESYRSPGIGALANVAGLVFKNEQSGYLAGYLAGLVVRASRPHRARNTISTINDSVDPASSRYVAGFRAGARAADPKVQLLAGFSDELASAARCQTIARSQIAAGSALVFPVAGSCSAGALTAASAAHVWAIGSSADATAPGARVLVSAVDRVDRALSLTLDALAHGTFRTGHDVELGLAQNAVALVALHDVPRAIRRLLVIQSNRVRAGRVSIPTGPAPAR